MKGMKGIKENNKPFIDQVVDFYISTVDEAHPQGNMSAVADQFGITRAKVNKILITAGVIDSPLHRDIMELKETLPLYQKKATLMDAMCHSIESFWSVNSTDESKGYSKEALSLIVNNYKDYLVGDNSKNELMLKASHIAGKAINITQTTAGHAMSYKLTSLFKIAHGHAAALCIKGIWPFMVKHTGNCIDVRGEEYLKNTFDEIADAMGCSCVEEAIDKFRNMVDELELPIPENATDKDYEVLKNSVNPVRLKNNPVALSVEDIDIIYHDILGDKQK